MAERLTDRFRPGDAVEILLALPDSQETWHPGRVVALDHPGVWVETASAQYWFVTNTRHIRPAGGEKR